MNTFPLPFRRRTADPRILPTKRQYRTRSLLGAFAMSLLVLLTSAAPALAVNEPQLRQTSPRDLGSVQSTNAQLLRATFDRDLEEDASWFRLRDNTTAVVAGAIGFDHRSGTGGARSITFSPDVMLSEALSPYSARVRACAALPSIPCGVITFSFFVDDTAPAAPGITDPLNGQYRTDQPVLVRGFAEAGTQILIAEDMDPTNIIATSYTSNTGTYIVPMPWGPEDGVSHTIRAYARDEAGNDSPSSGDITFVHDSVEFKPIITSPFNGQVFASSTVTVAGLAKASSVVDVEEGGPTIGVAVTGPDRRWSTTVSAAEGIHTISASANDGVVIDGPSNAVTFIVDLTAPVAPVIITPAPGSMVSSRTVRVSGSAEPNATVHVSEGATLLAAVPVGLASDWEAFVTLPEGAHTLTAVAIDAAGNQSPAATVSFSIDTVAPVRPLILAPAEGEVISTNGFLVDGKAEAGAVVRLYEGLSLLGTDTASGLGDWLIAGTFLDGAHDLIATATDPAGNISEPSLLRHFGVDTVAPGAPQILSPVGGSFTDRAEVLVSGTAEPNAGVTIEEASAPLGTATADGTGAWSTRITFTNGTHVIVANATDLGGNIGPDSASVTFDVTLPPLDVTPPGAPAITLPAPSSLQPGLVLVKGISEVGATVSILSGFSVVASTTADSAGGFSVHVYFDTGSHTITARATDRAGNVGPVSSSRTFSVDATRPEITLDAPAVVVPGTDIGVYAVTPISGSATDLSGVVRIELEFTNKLDNSPAGTATAAVCTGCPGASITWEAQWAQPGFFDVLVFAVDVVGNRSLPERLTFLTTGVTA